MELSDGIGPDRTGDMAKEKLIEIIQRILKTDAGISFLTALKEPELETLVACIRNRVDNNNSD